MNKSQRKEKKWHIIHWGFVFSTEDTNEEKKVIGTTHYHKH